jgi:hypothetical protein
MKIFIVQEKKNALQKRQSHSKQKHPAMPAEVSSNIIYKNII